MSSVEETRGQRGLDELVERLEDYTVVDVDVHEFDIDPNTYAEYVDDRWVDRVRHTARTDEPLTQAFGATVPYDVNPENESDTVYGLPADVTPLTPDGIMAFMDAFNTDYSLLHGHMATGFCTIPDGEYAAALCRAYNDYMLDEWLDEGEGLKCEIRVNPDSPDRAAEEIHRLADEDDMVGVHMDITVDRPFGHDQYEPIWAAAERAGLPITFHPGTSSPAWTPEVAGGVPLSTPEYIVGLNNAPMAHLASLIMAGVPERHPDLEFVSLEHGISWIPWLQGRLDKNYERRQHELQDLSKPPSEYLRDQFYFGTQPMEDVAGPARLVEIIEMLGPDMLMYSTDFPHYDFDFPSMLTIPELDAEAERKIFGGNALDVFDF